MNKDREYDEDLKNALKVLREGGVIAYPTDTVWGIGCDATCSDAVRRIFAIKRREDSKALIALVCDEKMLSDHISGVVDKCCLEYIDRSDKPVTVVYPGGKNVAPELLAQDGSIGVRMVRRGFASDLCRELGRPLVSTSANLSGRPSASVYGDIDAEIIEAMDYVAETGRDCQAPSCPSRVVKLTPEGDVVILRD